MPDLSESSVEFVDTPVYDGSDYVTLSEAQIEFSGGATGDDGIPPVVTLVSPLSGSIETFASVVVDVTDNVSLGRVLLVALFAALGVEELVHNGDRFAAAYSGASSRVAIAGGWRYTVRRGGGWTAPPTLTVYAVDATGTEG